MKDSEIKKAVRKRYGQIAVGENSCCAPAKSCCGGTSVADDISKQIGYSEEELKSAPEGANLGLGCGNPVAIASLKPGETVLDLGAGAGFDCFLAANKVGKKGRVIGIDMTPEMIEKARLNAAKNHYGNVEFRLGEIENLPVADNFVDIIISNCVINLVPDKKKVFTEAMRVLKPGGRIMISDMVLLKPISESVKNSITAYVGCVSGAVLMDDYVKQIKAAGFKNVSIIEESALSVDCLGNDPTVKAVVESMGLSADYIQEIIGSVRSAKISATKP